MNYASFRFWSRVNVSQKGRKPCWEWRGSVTSAGYGTFQFNKRTMQAHRWAYFLANGELPDDKYVCHSCDNKRCCNPGHLWLGTAQDNAKDMVSKGRQNNIVGMANGNRKITDDDVREIRASKMTRRALVEKFGLAPTYISGIRSGKHWKHI